MSHPAPERDQKQSLSADGLDLLVATTRTCRRFNEQQRLPRQTLEQLVDLARLSGSARNSQPWQYMIVDDAQHCERLFSCLGWAGYLSDWHGPSPGERPSAYLLCLLNHKWLKGSEKEAYFDLGIASQSLLLGAAARQIMGCRIASFSAKANQLYAIPEHLHLELIIALGAPVERVVLDEMRDADDIRYWRDEQQIHHVPKRSLRDVLVELQPSMPEK